MKHCLIPKWYQWNLQLYGQFYLLQGRMSTYENSTSWDSILRISSFSNQIQFVLEGMRLHQGPYIYLHGISHFPMVWMENWHWLKGRRMNKQWCMYKKEPFQPTQPTSMHMHARSKISLTASRESWSSSSLPFTTPFTLSEPSNFK